MATALLVGTAVTLLALGGRAAIKTFKQHKPSKFVRGGFQNEMTTNEALDILGLKSSSSQKDIKMSHRRIMLLNHPDKGGSPYLASKINEAKELLDNNK